MATKQFLTLEGLTTYDGLIKQYIGTEDAKSIKSLTVSGNTVSFYKTADASGTAAYTVNMPDVSGFMEKIEDANGRQIVISNSDGSVSESNITLDIDGADNDYKLVVSRDYTISDDSIGLSELLATGYDLSEHVGQLLVADYGHNGAQGIGISTLNQDDLATQSQLEYKIDKIDSATGGKITVSDANGGVVESAITVADVTGKIDKIASATGGKLVTSTSAGQVAESYC